MVKTFLLCALSLGLLSARADTRSDQSMEMSYSKGVSSAIGFADQKEGGTGCAGFKMTEVDLAAYAGLSITGIAVYSGAATNPFANPDTHVTLMIYNDDSATPVYTQDAEISSEAYARNLVTLDTPYLIKPDEPLYICYKLKFSAKTQNWVCVDGNPSPDPMTGLCCVAEGDEIPSPDKWLRFGDSFNGSLSMGVVISGETVPTDNAGIYKVTAPTSSMVGDKAIFTLDLRNPGNNNIRNLEIKVEPENEEAYFKTVDFKPYFKKVTFQSVEMELEPFTTIGNKDVRFTITKVNGVDNVNTANSGIATTVSIGDSYSRMPVIEEATGTWCGWCVAGIVMLEKIKEKYGDKVALIAAHQGDRMAVPSYQPFISKYTTGLPAAMFNREEVLEVKPGLADNLIDEILSHSIFAKIDLGEFKMEEGSNDVATFETFSEFVLDTNKKYCVSVAIVEDGLGPYVQKNYYSDELPNDSGPMYGWEDKPLEAPGIYYDDVARGLSSFPGEALPDVEFEAGKPIPLTVTVTGMKNVKADKFRAIAMLTEEDTGYIINAAMKEFDNPKSNSVMNFAGGNVTVKGGMGRIDVSGADRVEVFTVNGFSAGTENLAPGMYIVRADGIVKKVIVR